MKKIFALCFAILTATSVWCQVPVNVQKVSGTNTITGDLVVPTGKSISVSGSGTNAATSISSGATVASPKITTGIYDANGNELFLFTATASAVNEVTYANAATAGNPTFTASGGDSNIGFNFVPKGTGQVNATFNSSSSGSTGFKVTNSNTAGVSSFHLLNDNSKTAAFTIYGSAFSLAYLRNNAAFGADDSIYVIPDSSTSSGGTHKFAVVTGGYSNNPTLEITPGNPGRILVGNPTDDTTTALQVNGAIRPSQTGGIIATTTNNDASAGSVGEAISSLVAVGSPVSLTTNTGTNVTSISLTAGDWDVSGNVNLTEGTATVTGASAGITSTSATVPTNGSEVYSGVQVTLLSGTDSITLPPKRFSLSGTTTVYLVAKSTFSAGTVDAFGSILARRVR